MKKISIFLIFIVQYSWAQPDLFSSSGPVVNSNGGSNYSGPNTLEFDTIIDVGLLANQVDITLNYPDSTPGEIIRFQHLLHPDCCFINGVPDLSQPFADYNFLGWAWAMLAPR